MRGVATSELLACSIEEFQKKSYVTFLKEVNED